MTDSDVGGNIPFDVALSHVFLNPNKLLSHLIFLEKIATAILVLSHAPKCLAVAMNVDEDMRNQDESRTDSDAMV